MIYDIRQVDDLSLCLAGRALRATCCGSRRSTGPGQRVHATALRDRAAAGRAPRRARISSATGMTWIELDQPHDTSERTGSGAGRGQARCCAPPASPAWEAVSRRGLRRDRHIAAIARAFPVRQPAGLARSGNPRLCRRQSFPPRAGRCSTALDLNGTDQGRHDLRDRRHHGDHHRRRCRSPCGAASARTSPTS